MRFHGKELGLRWRLGVAARAIIGGLLVLLMVAAASCDDAQPEPTVQPTISSPGSTASATLTPTETPILISVDTDASEATVGEPPFPGLEKLVVSSDHSVIGQVEEISELQTTPRRDDPAGQVAYYEASVKVDHVIFGFHYDRVDVHVPVHYLMDNDRHIPAYAPPLEPGETVLLFLTRDESLFGPDDTKLVITDGDEARGKFAVRDGRVTTSTAMDASKPLDEVTAWIEAARFSLAKPGTLTGEVSGLDEVDHATIRLLDLGHSERVEDGVLVTEWTAGNGPWEQGGLRLSQGNYALVAEADGYIHASWPLGLVFEVPAEGMNWRQANIGVGLLRPEEADKVTSTGGVWRPGRSVGGRITGIPDEVAAKVRIQHLPRVPNEVYAIGPPLPKETELYIPLELTCLEEIGHLEPEETVAVVEVHNGRWGLSGSGLSGKRHLITIEAPGLRVKPAGYVAVVFAGIADHQVWNVDFCVGDSEGPDCHSDSGVVEPAAREALLNSLKDPMARIAERVPGFGGALRDPSQNIVYIYLQDASMQEDAENVLTEVFGPDFLAGREVRVLEGEYSMAHLDAWYKTMMAVVSQVPGIVYTDLDEAKNRIEIVMYPRRGGREEMEAALATVDVPRGAIVIDVGCEGFGQWPLDLGEPPDEAFLRAIDYSLEVVSQASYGETVRMKLTLRNVSDEPVSFFLGGRPPYDFVVSTPEGEQVWHWKCAKIPLLPLDSETLEPGEELEFVGEWEQIDNRGEPVAPSSYLVRGVLTLDWPEKIVTEAHKLEVQMPTTAYTPSPTATPTPLPLPTVERDRAEEPPQGSGVEIGAGYPYTLYVHCGIRDARFDGRLWMADPMLSDGSGNPPLDWTPDDSVGIMKLVRDDLAVFTARSGRIVGFKPWPLDVEWRPCA